MLLASCLLASSAGKHYTKLRRARARTPYASHGFSLAVLLVIRLSLTFYSRKGPYWRTTHDAKVAALKSAIMQILHIVQSQVSLQ